MTRYQTISIIRMGWACSRPVCEIAQYIQSCGRGIRPAVVARYYRAMDSQLRRTEYGQQNVQGLFAQHLC